MLPVWVVSVGRDLDSPSPAICLTEVSRALRGLAGDDQAEQGSPARRPVRLGHRASLPRRHRRLSGCAIISLRMVADQAVGFRTGWAGQPLRRRSPIEVITVWWQDIIIVAVIALGIYGFVVFARYMTQQMTRKTDRRAEDMYDEFGSARKEKDRWPI